MTSRIAAGLALAAAGLGAGLIAWGQAPPASAAATVKGAYTRIKTNFIKASEKMPEENYAYKPVDALETFGDHGADTQQFRPLGRPIA